MAAHETAISKARPAIKRVLTENEQRLRAERLKTLKHYQSVADRIEAKHNKGNKR